MSIVLLAIGLALTSVLLNIKTSFTTIQMVWLHIGIIASFLGSATWGRPEIIRVSLVVSVMVAVTAMAHLCERHKQLAQIELRADMSY